MKYWVETYISGYQNTTTQRSAAPLTEGELWEIAGCAACEYDGTCENPRFSSPCEFSQAVADAQRDGFGVVIPPKEIDGFLGDRVFTFWKALEPETEGQ